MSIQKTLSGISTIYTNNLYSDNQINTYDISNNYITCDKAPTINSHLTNKLYVDSINTSFQNQTDDLSVSYITISGGGYFSKLGNNIYLNGGNFGINLFTTTNAYALNVNGNSYINGSLVCNNVLTTNLTDINDLKTKTTNITYGTGITNFAANKSYLGNELFLNTLTSNIYFGVAKTNQILCDNTNLSIRSNGTISFKDVTNTIVKLSISTTGNISVLGTITSPTITEIKNKITDISNNIFINYDDKICTNNKLSFYYTSENVDLNFYDKSNINDILLSYYTKSNIDNTLLSYYTITDIDLNFYNSLYIDSNFYTRSAITTNYYTKSNVNNKFLSIVNATNTYYNKSEIDTNFYTKVDFKNKFKIGVITKSTIPSVTLTSKLLDLTDTNLYFNFDIVRVPQNGQGPAGSNGSDGAAGSKGDRGERGAAGRDGSATGDVLSIISMVGTAFGLVALEATIGATTIGTQGEIAQLMFKTMYLNNVVGTTTITSPVNFSVSSPVNCTINSNLNLYLLSIDRTNIVSNTIDVNGHDDVSFHGKQMNLNNVKLDVDSAKTTINSSSSVDIKTQKTITLEAEVINIKGRVNFFGPVTYNNSGDVNNLDVFNSQGRGSQTPTTQINTEV